jgi:hypothetical protein
MANMLTILQTQTQETVLGGLLVEVWRRFAGVLPLFYL